MPSDLSLLYRTYDAFNARDVDAALATMTPDVVWSDEGTGERLHGHDAVRDHWTSRWQSLVPTLTPIGYTLLNDGRLRLEVRQVVRDHEGNRLFEGAVSSVYTFRDGLIAKMERV